MRSSITEPITELRALRINRREPLTLKEVQDRTGFHASHISNVERGMIGAGPRFVAALAKTYRISIPECRALCAAAFESNPDHEEETP